MDRHVHGVAGSNGADGRWLVAHDEVSGDLPALSL
jgi:hypothetical protein